jgi:hypothetical protein
MGLEGKFMPPNGSFSYDRDHYFNYEKENERTKLKGKRYRIPPQL